MTQGALVNLVSLGQQDAFTVGNPQVTFWKHSYKRHTNFACETAEYPLDSAPGFGKQGYVKIQRYGDLVKEIYFKVKLPAITPSSGAKFAWVRKIGHAMINDVSFEIGGTTIDKQYGIFLNIWYELARCPGKKEAGFLNMIGDVAELTEYNGLPKAARTLYVPLQFWFNRSNGLALPLIALQYHECFIRVNFQEGKKLIVSNAAFHSQDLSQVRLDDVNVLVNYVFLDAVERRKFAQVAHEYLIEQVQHNGNVSIMNKNVKTDLKFNHPTKELIWAMILANYSEGKEFLCYTHEDKWGKCGDCNVFVETAKKILGESIVLYNAAGPGNVPPQQDPPSQGVWQDFQPGDVLQPTSNGNIIVTNNTTNKVLWVNANSLSVGSYSLTDKIKATIVVSATEVISVSNVTTTLTMRDLSIPVERMTDTRATRDDPKVYQYHNFGTLIDGTVGPVLRALIIINGSDRFHIQEGDYFNWVQPHQHHTNTPAPGVYLYAFALNPEQAQPSGAANLSRIDSTQLVLEFEDRTFVTGLPDIGFFSTNNKLFIYGRNINVLRIIAGMGGLAYAS